MLEVETKKTREKKLPCKYDSRFNLSGASDGIQAQRRREDSSGGRRGAAGGVKTGRGGKRTSVDADRRKMGAACVPMSLPPEPRAPHNPPALRCRQAYVG